MMIKNLLKPVLLNIQLNMKEKTWHKPKSKIIMTFWPQFGTNRQKDFFSKVDTKHAVSTSHFQTRIDKKMLYIEEKGTLEQKLYLMFNNMTHLYQQFYQKF